MPEKPLNDALAEKRTVLAQNRSLLAAERTFAAWIRTGFAIAGAGLTLAEALKGLTFPLVIGAVLVFTGILTFLYALYEYRRGYHFIQAVYVSHDQPMQDFRWNVRTGTALIVILILACVAALIHMLT